MAKINETQNEQANQTETLNNNISPDYQSILDRLDTLEKENKELKEEKKNTFTKAKEKYEWPRKYSFKLWGGIPVEKYTSFKKDKARDFLYKNEYWTYVSNHYLKVQLKDAKDLDIEVNEFNKNYVNSKKMFASIKEEVNGKKEYTFSTEEYWEVTVDGACIN